MICNGHANGWVTNQMICLHNLESEKYARNSKIRYENE
jgi:hypothetical protein